jgi:hypothetical protein
MASSTIKIVTLIAAYAALATTTSHAFVVSSSYPPSSSLVLRSATKGFAPPPPEPRKKSSGAIDREIKSNKYDEISKGGGQEYRIFVRQFGSDDRSWLPVGSIAVPRGAQVSDAVFANEEGLRNSIVRTYDKLRG